MRDARAWLIASMCNASKAFLRMRGRVVGEPALVQLAELVREIAAACLERGLDGGQHGRVAHVQHGTVDAQAHAQRHPQRQVTLEQAHAGRQ